MRIHAILLSSLCVIILNGCETTSRSFSRLKVTSVPGAYYYAEIWSWSSGGYSNIYGTNKTSGWVTYFLFDANVQGNLNLDDLVSGGMPVIATPIYALQNEMLGQVPLEKFYWVWARAGKWMIRNNTIIPDHY